MGESESIGQILKRVMQRGSRHLSADLSTASSEQTGPKCKVCLDIGWVHPRLPSGAVDYSRSVRCACKKEEDNASRQASFLNKCKLPEKLTQLTFENFERLPWLAEAYDAALQLAQGVGDVRWLVLMSGVDRGKTHMAAAICNKWVARGLPARYAFVPDLLNELRNGYDKDDDRSYAAQLHLFSNVAMLVLDDLPRARELRTSWRIEQLEDIIHLRDVNNLPLCVTTNAGFDEMTPRIASRLQRAQGSRVVVIDGPEYRLRNAK